MMFHLKLFIRLLCIDACYHADDLWLKAIELIAGIPVVCCRPFGGLDYIPDTNWANAKFGENILYRCILTDNGQAEFHSRHNHSIPYSTRKCNMQIRF